MEDIMRITVVQGSLFALAISATLLAGTARAQVQMLDNSAPGVTVFESAPTAAQLRKILVPSESGPSAPRSIVIARPDIPKSTSLQPATATTVEPMVRPKSASSAGAAEPASHNENEASAAVAFRINFASTSAAIPRDGVPFLKGIAELLKQEPTLALTVEGHTDGYGSVDYNNSLSKKRADAVADYLETQGAARDQLMPIGRGKSEPLIADPYDSRNRRVQFSRLTFKDSDR
jgi:OOP family OmpA-OmpF porin